MNNCISTNAALPPTPPTPCPDEVSAFQACHSGLDPKSVERSQSQMMTVGTLNRQFSFGDSDRSLSDFCYLLEGTN
ncbi:hypothetical protein [Nostoc sp. C110]|uniref:hypothetical protein n=1 Tax=Nostoc sp. C110 TaxID=3349876 RepID=UPI00370DE15D